MGYQDLQALPGPRLSSKAAEERRRLILGVLKQNLRKMRFACFFHLLRKSFTVIFLNNFSRK